MAAYNWGAGGVERAVAYTGYADYWELFKRNNLPAETKNYVPIILAMTIISNHSSRYGFEVTPDPPASMEKVSAHQRAGSQAGSRITGLDAG